MENSSIEEFLFKYRWPLLGVALGILLILFGIFAATRQLPFFSQDKIEILSEGDKGNGKNVVVEIAGAVQKPGVYALESGKRIEDALVTAGGLSAEADREWVARTLNRAAKLTDGQKIFIPLLRSSSFAGQADGGGKDTPGVGDKGNEGNGGFINVNTASQFELEALPGIGPVTARKIIDNRPYSDVSELLTRKILGKKVYEENREKLSVY